MCRLVAEARPHYVFLENTAGIIRDKDYQGLLDKLIRLGYTCAFFVSIASRQGAAQTRARWLLLARRSRAKPFSIRRFAVEKLRQLFGQPIERKTVDCDHRRALATRWSQRKRCQHCTL